MYTLNKKNNARNQEHLDNTIFDYFFLQLI